MTEAQRDYLADLAGKKGVRIDNSDDKSAAWASAKIEELKALPDKTFGDAVDVVDRKIKKKTAGVISEVSKWTFQA